MKKEITNLLTGETVTKPKEYEHPLLELADFIENSPLFFDMANDQPKVNRFDSECGTAGCIAGHAAVLWSECRKLREYRSYHHPDYYYFTPDQDGIERKLWITCEQRRLLCYEIYDREFEDNVAFQDVSKPMVLATLRRFAEDLKTDADAKPYYDTADDPNYADFVYDEGFETGEEEEEAGIDF